MENSHQVAWDSSLDYERIEWQRTLMDLGEAPGMAYQDVLETFDSVWCGKGLLVTHNKLAVTWKARLV